MTRGVRKCLVGSLVLVALAGCGRSVLQYAAREPWRAEAEASCLKSGAVREKAGLVRIEPIEGPGVCGADFPLKVATLGDVSSAIGFAGEVIRPPGAVPNGSRVVPAPRWPVAAQPQPLPPPQPVYSTPPSQHTPPGAPLSLSPPGMNAAIAAPQTVAPRSNDVYREPYPPPAAQSSPGYRTVPTRRVGDPGPAIDDGFQVRPRNASAPPPAPEPVPALGPQREPRVTGSIRPVEIKPTATLACPIVSALDRWVAQAVQPAAQKWFGQPVVEIRQISAYSCRGMNGQPGARISEHAFGNALDIAAFVLADGKRITIKNGWRGSPEEQGFLRDVQAAACDTFTTVLAPGSNRFHYDHFHFDLMRRASGRRICNPHAEDGELVAARARANPVYAGRSGSQPALQRPGATRNDPVSANRRGDNTVTGSIGSRRAPARQAPSDDDDDWIEDDGPRPEIDWAGDRHKVQ